MKQPSSIAGIFLLAAALPALAGCGGPRTPERADLSPDRAAARAIELFDRDGDGRLDATELQQSPGLLAALPRADRSGDGTLTRQEIEDRLRTLQALDTVIVSGAAVVMLDGRPLEGATVTFEPEPFLSEWLQPATGTTDSSGHTYAGVEGAEFPGLRVGFYRVRISKTRDGRELLPARYNTETELGHEAAEDDRAMHAIPQFELRSG